ncbi:MAGUK p55 subfamily member 2 isoform X1 [Kogia breviceps]|uniref:MAGUK p55 subfamily member 2 isoform X1 n=2 Tax=Kogia breviceps TaxID=27615 RepID=UPI0034D168CC
MAGSPGCGPSLEGISLGSSEEAELRREAMQQVLDNLGSLPNATGAAELDLIFLRGIMESPIVRSLAKAHERLEETKLEAVRDNNLELVQEILRDLAQLAEQSSTAAELARILQEPHFQSLLETHDSVASKTYETPPPSPGLDPTFSNQPVPPDAVRMVGIRKTAGEHLGVTFRVEGGELVIARILHGGMVAQQGLLHVGDIIKEVNGQPVGSDPRALQELLRNASGSVILKILPSYQEPHLPRQVFVKCHFDYDPARDSLIPCKEAGLRFNAGDLLQIVNQDDANWWQACHVEGGSAGLIPSQLLEEKRKAFVKRDLELTPTSGTLCGSISGKKKKRMMYLTTKNAEFDRHELLIYEEVARMPPFRRKTLVLIGAQGVGRRSLKNKLIMWAPDRYGTTVPYTSRRPKDSEREGQGYSFVSRAEMEADIRAGRYLEHGEYEGNLYGTRIDSIRGVVAAGRVCVLDVNPQAVKVLRTAEFVPYVVFIEAPDFETLRAMNRTALESGVSTKQLTLSGPGQLLRPRRKVRAGLPTAAACSGHKQGLLEPLGHSWVSPRAPASAYEADLRRTVEESSRIQRGYGHYFDLSLVNSNLERTFRELQAALEKLRTEPQWVPVSWVY